MVYFSDQFVICEVAIMFALTRWLLSLALNLILTDSSSSSCCSSPSSSSLSLANLSTMKKNLNLTTLEDIQHGCVSGNEDVSCAVCLESLRKNSKVWELTNCRHVFHKECLEKWVSYDERFTCPLCRAPVVTVAPTMELETDPSWAVERMLYLLGDDLLP